MRERLRALTMVVSAAVNTDQAIGAFDGVQDRRICRAIRHHTDDHQGEGALRRDVLDLDRHTALPGRMGCCADLGLCVRLQAVDMRQMRITHIEAEDIEDALDRMDRAAIVGDAAGDCRIACCDEQAQRRHQIVGAILPRLHAANPRATSTPRVTGHIPAIPSDPSPWRRRPSATACS